MEILVIIKGEAFICSSFSGAQNFASDNGGKIDWSDVFEFFKKDAIASLLDISRPTFDKKITEKTFNKEECEILEDFFYFIYKMERSHDYKTKKSRLFPSS